ncbi:hypothetical protein QYF61_021373 [Mycteria americana]|uniref:Uncharacterized protein n=1 Tax=Mycteria americana TaxID=33587 RepID=A0AAN7RJH4_MYCAM|nr:hypothetical protein QYF61_021373 [Mycteria americana]
MKKWVEMRRDLGPSLDKCRVIQSTEHSGDQEEADGQRPVLCRTVPEDGAGLPTLSAKEAIDRIIRPALIQSHLEYCTRHPTTPYKTDTYKPS